MKQKRELAELTVSQGEKWITELSNSELKKIFEGEKTYQSYSNNLYTNSSLSIGLISEISIFARIV